MPTLSHIDNRASEKIVLITGHIINMIIYRVLESVFQLSFPIMSQSSARFTTQSISKHVAIMTLTNSVGLMAMFLVDLVDLYFLNLLGIEHVTAAVGFATQLIFYLTALSIGFLITSGVIVSIGIGEGNQHKAKLMGSHIILISTLVIAIISLIFCIFAEEFLLWLGAKSDTLSLGVTYAQIMLPSSVILVISMVCSGILRAIGDAKRSMFVTLISAAVNLILDPIFIFVFDWGVAGAAYASVIARLCMMGYALYCVVVIHDMWVKPNIKQAFLSDIFPISRIAIPNLLTNLATPIGSSVLIVIVAEYGNSAVSGYVVIGRIIPVAFSVLFALSGAISPIMGQNFGAKKFDRVRETYRAAIIFACVVIVLVSFVLFLIKPLLLSMFSLTGDGRLLISLFCSGLSLFFITDAILFSTNAAFNSLGYSIYSTIFNYSKFFLGVIPMTYLLSQWLGIIGLSIGLSAGSFFVMFVSINVCRRLMNRLENLKKRI